MNFIPRTILTLSFAWLAFVPPTLARINELNFGTASQYFEIRGRAGLDVSPFHYLVIGDGQDGDSGVIETVIPLQGIVPDDGFYLAAEPTFAAPSRVDFTTEINFETDDNVTHLVVGGFTGAVGMDLDINDDCEIDVAVPWGPVIDGIALVKEHNPPTSTECHYGGNALGEGLGFPVVGSDALPSHVFAVPDGSNDYRTGTSTAGDQNSFYVYDNFDDARLDDFAPVSWTASRDGILSITKEDDLSFVSDMSASGGKASTTLGDLPARSEWSLRARLTLNEVLGSGIAGVGVTGARWSSVFGGRTFGAGEMFDTTTESLDDDILGKEVVVQFRATSEKLEGHFWLADAPGDIISVERENMAGGTFEPRLSNNGSDATFHEVWISTEAFPLPVPGTSLFADINGDGGLDSIDINLLSGLVRSQSDRLIYDVDSNGTLEPEDRRVWVEDAFGTQFGDANLDRKVDFADFLHVSANFGSSGGWSEGDFDGDGAIGFPDFLLLSKNFNETAEAVSVPEPSTSFLGWFILSALVCNRRNRVANIRRTMVAL